MSESESKMDINDDSDSGSSSSDSDMDSGDDAQIAATKTKSEELEAQISQNPYLYEVYLSLVETYEHLGDWDNLKKTYERFAQHFPLTEDIWLKWIRNEIKFMSHSSDDGPIYINSLFEKALQDYLSVNVWLEYVLFSMDRFPLNETRDKFKRALNVAGCHFIKGSLIWDSYRDFEIRHLMMLKDTAQISNQIELIGTIFEKQLSIPLKQMNLTFSEWLQWKETMLATYGKDVAILKVDFSPKYRLATNLVTKWEPIETQLNESDSESSKLQIYWKYLQTVQDDDTTKSLSNYEGIVQCLFERTVRECCLYSGAWIRYLEWVQYQCGTSDKKVLESLIQRAVRNCMWDGSMWAYRIRLLEHLERSHEEITKCFEEALHMGLSSGEMYVEVWLAYVEHFRRITDKQQPQSLEKFKTLLENAVEFVQNYDFQCKLLRLAAWAHAEYFKDYAAMRQLFAQILTIGSNGNKYEFWLELVRLEQQFGDEKHQRKTWQRALNNVTDWPQLIAEQWLDFERKYGSNSSMMSCQYLISHCKTLQRKEVTVSGEKRKRGDLATKTSKKSNLSKTKKAKKSEEKIIEDDDSTKKQSLGSDVFTLFVRGFPNDSSKESIEALFKEFGSVTAVRTVTTKSGQLKNFAYVDFEEKTAADNAIQSLHNKNMDDNKILFVAYSDPPKKNYPNVETKTNKTRVPTDSTFRKGYLNSTNDAIVIRLAKSKLSIGLVPSVIQRQQENGNETKAPNVMTNDDFRKAFLQK